MVRFIFNHKNKLMITSFVLIVIGFVAHFAFGNELIFNITFITASLLGIIPIALQAFQALRVKVISIDLLVTIAVIGAFVIKSYEESAIVTFLFLFGAYLEQRTLMKTRSAIKELTEMAPETAMKVFDDGTISEVDIYDIDVGDLLLVKTGDKVPVDGVVTSGDGYVNEATITGEPLAQHKNEKSFVYAGTTLENGTLYIRAEKIGEETVFGKIIELVEEAQDSKSQAEKFIDTFAKFYTPFVLLLGLVVYLFTFDVATAVTILVLGCPGALVIGIPVSNVAGIGNGARHGVLLKGSEVIRDFSRVDTIIFDKTGTLTTGEPKINDITHFSTEQEQAIAYLVALEQESNHPLANAIVTHFNIETNFAVKETEVTKGQGISAVIDGKNIHVGNRQLMETFNVPLSLEVEQVITRYENDGNSVVIMAIEQTVTLVLGIRDEIRPGIKKELIKLKRYGVKQLILLSGDNQGSVDVVNDELKLDIALGNMLPEDKANYLKALQEAGKIVAFVGDGINDSPSLALAHIGMAMGSGTDVAIETSNVVLMNNDFSKISHALGLTKRIVWNMWQNIIIALSVVVVLIVSLLAADWMNMTIGMFVHEASILVVIFNGMRLLRFKVKN